jgi:hypothetical protein
MIANPLLVNGGSGDGVSFDALLVRTVAEGLPISGEGPGQKCLLGSIDPLEMTWDGSSWYLSGPAGVVNDNEHPSSYRLIVFDGGALSSRSYNPSDL